MLIGLGTVQVEAADHVVCKSYGFVHTPQLGLPKVPCQESDPRIPQPYEDEVFYYAQYDVLAKLAAGKTWDFAEIRPDLVVGWTPTPHGTP